MMVHTMMNVLGTPVRAKERERKQRAREAGIDAMAGRRERLRRRNQRRGEREKGGFSVLPPMVA